jgi:hypothetical protein
MKRTKQRIHHQDLLLKLKQLVGMSMNHSKEILLDQNPSCERKTSFNNLK